LAQHVFLGQVVARCPGDLDRRPQALAQGLHCARNQPCQDAFALAGQGLDKASIAVGKCGIGLGVAWPVPPLVEWHQRDPSAQRVVQARGDLRGLDEASASAASPP
jgi:hypothetical protein